MKSFNFTIKIRGVNHSVKGVFAEDPDKAATLAIKFLLEGLSIEDVECSDGPPPKNYYKLGQLAVCAAISSVKSIFNELLLQNSDKKAEA